MRDVCGTPAGYCADVFLPDGGTAPNSLTLTTTFNADLDIEGSLVVPGTTIQSVTDSVQVHAFDGPAGAGTTLETLEAYDVDGVLIGSDSAVTPIGGAGVVLSISTPGIAKIRLSMDGDGGDFDNLLFNAPTPVAVPALSSLCITLLGTLLGLAGWQELRA